MPQAVAVAAVWIAKNLTWKAIGMFLLKTAVTVAAAYGLGRLLSRKPTGSITSGSPLDVRIDSLAPQRIVYGETAVGPVVRFRHVAGANNKYLYLILIWAAHECEAITLKADGATVPLDGSGFATGTFAGVLRCTHHLGAYNQTADANFVAEIGGLWTANHKLQGRAYSALRLEVSEAKFPTGMPVFTALVKGRKVFDWRDGTQDIDTYSTWKWSDNNALCTADFIRGVPMLNGAGTLVRPLGVGASDSRLPSAKWIACANACDETVALAAGGTEKRYTLNGAIDADASPPDVLDAMAGSMAGKIVPIGAEFHPYAGVWSAPDFTVDETMVRGLPSVSNPLPRRERINIVKGTFSNPAANYQADDFPQQVANGTLGLADYITDDGGDLAKDLALVFTTSHTMAQRIARIALLRSRQGLVTSWPCNLRAIPALTGENVQLTSTEFGWTTKNFELVEFTLKAASGDDRGIGIVPDLLMQETDSSIFTWSTTSEGVKDPAPNTTLTDPRTVAPPTSLVLTSAGEGLLQPDGTYVPRLKLSWTMPADQAVQSGGEMQIQFKTVAAPDWSDWSPVPGNQTFDFITDVLIGTSYDVRIRGINNFNVPSDWATPAAGAHTVVGDTSAPNAPTGLSVVAYAGYNEIKWSPSSSADISEYKVFRHTSDNAAAATEIGEIDGTKFRDPTATPGVQYWYYVASVDGSENVGTRTAAGNVTTAAVPSTDVVPTDPTAATKTGQGTYLSGDGGVFSKLLFTLPGLPANARWQNLLFRKNGEAQWMLGGQYENAAQITNVPLDDLTPGVSYEVATQAFSAYGKGSAIVGATSSPFTAPNKTSAPGSPSGVAYIAGNSSSYQRPPAYFGGALCFSVRINWTAPADKDVAYYEWAVSVTDSDAAADAAAKFIEKDIELIYFSTVLPALYFRVRAVDRTGNPSAWAGGGTNLNTVMGYAAGNMSEQDKSNVKTSGVKLGSTTASSVQQIKAKFDDTVVPTLTGGAATEYFTVSLTNRGFSTKPDAGIVQCASDRDILARYDFDHASNSSTMAYVEVFMRDGSNLPAGAARFSVELTEI